MERIEPPLCVDLDGTLFKGATPIPGARETIARARSDGHRISYLTNNGSRNPREVAAHLSKLGFEATQAEVVTSGQASLPYQGRFCQAPAHWR